MSNARSVSGRRTPRTIRPSLLALEGRTLLSGVPRVDTFAVPTVLSGAGQIVDGPDGDLWFTETSGTIGRITTTGQIVEFPLPVPVGGTPPLLGGLTAGPDGALWAIDVVNDQVDRIAHDGQVTTFPLPAGQVVTPASLDTSSSSGSIVAGADGNLWFGASSKTLYVPGTIDRITPQGVVTSFPLPLGGGNAVEVAAGPAGIWFTDPSANRVGEVDFSGHVVEYGAPVPANVIDVNSMGLVVGPDGDAYYLAQSQTTVLVKVAPGGSMTPVTLPGSQQMVTDLLAGSDGVYFQSSANDGTPSALDRIAPDGTLTTVTTSVPQGFGMAFGPDGNLWVTEGFYAEISRVVLAPTPVPVPGPTLVIGEPPPTQIGDNGSTAPSVVAPVGEAASTKLAIFTNSPDVTVGAATIDWGDGSTPSAGTIAIAPGSTSIADTPATPFVEGLITGSHAYAKLGSYTVTVTIQGTGPGGAPMSASIVEPISAVDPSPSLQPSLNLEAGQSIAFQGPILFVTTPTQLDGSGSDFKAMVNWGDGSAPTAGTVVGGQGPDSSFIPYPGVPSSLFEVSGGHTYAKVGSYTVNVTLTDAFGHVSTESTPIQVVPGRLAIVPVSPVALTADPTSAGLTNGLDGVNLGTLTDFVGGASAANDSVTIDWGDGSAPTAELLYEPSTNPYSPSSEVSFLVGGIHAYAKAGNYTVKITAADPQGDSTVATTTAQVSPAILAVAPTNSSNSWGGMFSNIGATAGETVSGTTLFTITPANSTDRASDFTATIHWGDGSAATTGTVELTAAGGFQVFGDHTYAGAGVYEVAVTVDGPGGSTAQSTASASVVLESVGELFNLTIPGFTSGLVSAPLHLANFLSGASASVAEFRATVDWGDGSPIQAATIQASTTGVDPFGTFDVIAGHNYAVAGTYTMTITAIGPNGLPDIVTNQAIVTAAPPVVVTPPGNPTSPIPPPTILSTPPVIITTPAPTPTPTPLPMPLPTVPTFTGPILTILLPYPWPSFAPSLVHHHKPARHSRHAHPVEHLKPAPHHVPAGATTKPAHVEHAHHVAAKRSHAVHPKKHPTGPVRISGYRH